MIRKTWLALVLLEIGVVGYNLTFFNRYLPVTEGWFSLYAQAIRNHQVPYRDFHLILPPLYPFLLAFFTSIFGDSFLALRIFGVLLMGSFAGVLFYILNFRFSAGISCLVAFVATIYYQAGTAHITYDFIQWMTFFSLGALALLVSAVSELELKNIINLSKGKLFFAGFLLACAGLTKQSNSVWIVLCITTGLLIIFYQYRNRKIVIWQILWFILGLSVPLLGVLVYLLVNQALVGFISQVILDASAAKGNILSIVWAWIPRHINSIEFSKVLLGFCAAFLIGLSLKDIIEVPIRSEAFPWRHRIYMLSPIGLLVIAFVGFFWLPSVRKFLLGGRSVPIVEVYYSIVIFSFSFCVIGLFLTRDKVMKLCFACGLGFIFGNGTSGGVSEAGSFLGFALLAGHMLQIAGRSNLFSLATFCLIGLLSLFAISNKWTTPYSWWGVREDSIFNQRTPSTARRTEGFYLNSSEVERYGKISELILKFSKESDEVLCLPALPIFNIISHRFPNRKVLVHWYDVIPDSVSTEESSRILKDPPKMILFLRQAEFVAQGHEMLFRGNRQIGQRVLFETVQTMLDRRVYRELANFDVPDGNTLLVLVRNEPYKVHCSDLDR